MELTRSLLAQMGLSDATPKQRVPECFETSTSAFTDIRHITLLTGPSGCGKTTALRKLAWNTGSRTHWLDPHGLPESELLPAEWLVSSISQASVSQALCFAGLCDPSTLQIPVNCLSQGERERLALAATVYRARPGDLLLVDEFCAHLDNQSARALYARLQRIVEEHDLRCVVATHRASDISKPLLSDISITPGSRPDWQHFAKWHHRAKKLGPTAGIWQAMLDGRAVGIVVYAYPGAANRKRHEALPREYSRSDMRARLTSLNRDVRLLQRVVVEPSLRGAGIAEHLITQTLPLLNVPYVECMTGNGRFLERAGFVNCGMSPPDPKLERVLNELGGQDPSALTDTATRETFLSSLVEPARNKLLRAVRAFLRPYIEARVSHLRGHVSRGYISNAAWQRLPEAIARCGHPPNYYLWTNPS